MRWNVVIGGQLFSKSLRGFTTYKLELIGQEGLFMSLVLLVLPFIILWIMVKLFMPENLTEHGKNLAATTA
jgi:predicted membrane protein